MEGGHFDNLSTVAYYASQPLIAPDKDRLWSFEEENPVSMNERQTAIASGNQEFLDMVVGLEMCRPNFRSALLHSFEEPATLSFEHALYSGYVKIDATNVQRESFVAQVGGGILCRVALTLAASISGDMKDKASLTDSGYQFEFAITRYERDGEHGFEMVEDPVPLPSRERLGRFVELTITMPPK
jgi:hypothetical protein